MKVALDEARPSRRAALAGLAPPLLAWFAASAVVLSTASADGFRPFSPLGTWARWDSALYLSVARGGYNAYLCDQANGDWCGNAGWFPGYPWLAGGLHLVGLPLAATALALSWLAWLGTLIVLWRYLLPQRPRPRASFALLYAAFAPGVVYDYGVFPLSLLVLATVVAFVLVLRGRWLAAGLAGAVATLAYPLGLLGPLACALFVLAGRDEIRQRARRVLALVGPPLLGLAAFVLVQRLETGHWNAYLLVQRKYGHHLEDPLSVVGSAVGTVVHSRSVALAPGAAVHTSVPALQTLLVVAVLGAGLVELALHRRSVSRAELLVAGWAVLVWLVSHAETNVSTYRSEATLVPLALLVRRLPPPIAGVVALAAALLVVPMTRLYVRTLLF